MANADAEVKRLLEILHRRDPNQPEFTQAVEEVLDTLKPLFAKDARYVEVMERMMEPERVIQFRVPWLDDQGKIQVNRGFRVQFNSAIGPYKGGLRLHPSVNLSIIKFLGFEQILKNSLTTLPMGGGKGGSDFDPKGKSDNEVMRFCQSFMTELNRHIGFDTDVPAGDIGVGGREIGYLFGQYKRITNTWGGVLTGKGRSYGGSLIRPEATGYGCVYFTQNMLKDLKNDDLKGKRVAISGSGNVAQFALQKLLQLGAIPVTLSDSGGYLYEPEGFTHEKLAQIMELKNVKRGRLSEYVAANSSATYHAGKRPWSEKVDIALPCATQNELNEEEAKTLVANGCIAVAEGANMPTTPEGIDAFKAAGVLFGPAKAANAGGVAVSGLEMSQNSMHLSWTSDEVDQKLHSIMQAIYDASANAAKEVGKPGDIQLGANVAGFLKVAEAMMAQGCV